MVVSTEWTLTGGRYVVDTVIPGGFMAQLYDTAGNPVGPVFSIAQQYLGNYTPGQAISLATGGYAMVYSFAGALLPGSVLNVASFSADGQLLATAPLSQPPGQGGLLPVGGVAGLYALPDGGFVAAWDDGQAFSSGPGRMVIREFSASGAPIGDSIDLGQIASGSPTVQVTTEGHYVVSWVSSTGIQQRTLLESAPPLTGDETSLVPSVTATLTASGGWTGATMLSNHALLVVNAQDDGSGGHAAAVQAYDAAGNFTAYLSGLGQGAPGEVFTPGVAALAVGAFYEVSFAGSTDYAIYSAYGQQVFAHGAGSSPNVGFIPLADGGYAWTDFADQYMGLFNPWGGANAWVSLAGYGVADRAVSLTDGGLALGFGQSVVAFNDQGQVEYSGQLSATGSGFALQMAALANGQVGEVWLSPDGGQSGLPTTIVFQAFGPHGASGAMVLGQDLDPWHTSFAVQAHADGSAAILWSQGGAIYGAEYGVGASGAHIAMVGDLASALAIQLPYDSVGLVQLQGGDVVAEVFDPATGRVARADLGAAIGDLSTVHALATDAGGLAVSWQGAAGTLGAVMDPWGFAGPTLSLPGGFLGVDGQGHAVTPQDAGGQLVMQTYALSDGGLFWAA